MLLLPAPVPPLSALPKISSSTTPQPNNVCTSSRRRSKAKFSFPSSKKKGGIVVAEQEKNVRSGIDFKYSLPENSTEDFWGEGGKNNNHFFLSSYQCLFCPCLWLSPYYPVKEEAGGLKQCDSWPHRLGKGIRRMVFHHCIEKITTRKMERCGDDILRGSYCRRLVNPPPPSSPSFLLFLQDTSVKEYGV